MSLNKHQFARAVREVLQNIELHSASALNLLLGTAAQESRFGTYLRQLGDGPARGVFQMEPATEADIWNNFLAYRPELSRQIQVATGVGGPNPLMLELNLAYQIAMCRVHYLRVPCQLPEPDDLDGLAGYWKRHYNTSLGAGTVSEFIDSYLSFVGYGRFNAGGQHER
jgi:hypothetical protein